MYNFSGCPCSVCGKPLSKKDDVVVCPDCGAPYHRTCYQAAGACVHAALHSTSFEWTPPASILDLPVCPVCGERNQVGAETCTNCGASLIKEQIPEPEEEAQRPNGPEMGFDYARFYQNAQNPSAAGAPQSPFDPARTVDGISCADWESYLGPFGFSYLSDFLRMQREGRKTSISLGATLFGPFYFFYRKAWKPAFGFLGIELLLSLPSLFQLMQLSGSPYAPNLSSTTLVLLARFATAASFAVMVFRGLYGKYLYQKSAAQRIRRIQASFPDSDRRAYVLRAQGGVSWAAVIGAFMILMVVGAVFSLLLGPNLDAILNLI